MRGFYRSQIHQFEAEQASVAKRSEDARVRWNEVCSWSLQAALHLQCVVLRALQFDADRMLELVLLRQKTNGLNHGNSVL